MYWYLYWLCCLPDGGEGQGRPVEAVDVLGTQVGRSLNKKSLGKYKKPTQSHIAISLKAHFSVLA